MNTTQTQLDSFQRAYVECAIWSSTGDNGEPLADDHNFMDIAPETLDKMQLDCNSFRAAHANLLDASGLNIEQQGHDFWLSRNGHGAGFFDRELPGSSGDYLQEAAEKFGSFDLYVGDDGQIYGQ